jgi:hypothetical protein
MGLFRDAASIAIPELAAARAKKRQNSQSSGSGSAAGGGQQQQPKRSIGQDLGTLAEKRLESGGKRPGGSGMDYTSGAMSLTGDIPGQSADDSLGNGRRKRSNGKRS